MKNHTPCAIAVMLFSTFALATQAKPLDGSYSNGCRLEGSVMDRGPERVDPNFKPEKTFEECKAACERQSKEYAHPKDPNYCTGFNFINSPTTKKTGLLPGIKTPEGFILPVYACQLLVGPLDYGSSIYAAKEKNSFLKMSVDSCIYPCGQPAICTGVQILNLYPGELREQPLDESTLGKPTLPQP